MNYKNLLFTYADGLTPEKSVGVLTLSRPAALNALNQELLSELKEFLCSSALNSLRCLIVTGAGEKAFVAGADIKEMQSFTPEQALAMAQNGQAIFNMIEQAPFASIAAVNGFALGGGLELAMSCDFMVASSKARFGLPEVSLGLIPGYGGTQRLPRYVGKSLARMITLTGDIYLAEQGKNWGLFAQVVEPTDLMPTCLKLAQVIAGRSPRAIQLAKQAIAEGFDVGQKAGLVTEAKYFAESFASADHNEGIAAFIDKRAPQFRGQ